MTAPRPATGPDPRPDPRLAINYSPEASELLRSRTVEVDLFKVPDWDELIEEAQPIRPVYVHFPHQIGAARERPELGRSAKLMAATGTGKFNVHAAPSSERFPDIGVGDVSAAAVDAVVDALAADLEPAIQEFGATAVLIENLIYRGDDHGLLRAGVEPIALHALVERTGCGLLLDVSHARISAATLGVDAWAYLDSLPVHAMQELHFSGVNTLDGSLRDHLPLLDVDWGFVDGVVGRVKAGAWPTPLTVAFEYGGVGPVFGWRSDVGVIAEQLPRLHEKVARLR